MPIIRDHRNGRAPARPTIQALISLILGRTSKPNWSRFVCDRGRWKLHPLDLWCFDVAHICRQANVQILRKSTMFFDVLRNYADLLSRQPMFAIGSQLAYVHNAFKHEEGSKIARIEPTEEGKLLAIYNLGHVFHPRKRAIVKGFPSPL